MVFSSIPFIFYFIPIFYLVFNIFNRKNIIILIGSIVFYIYGEGAYFILLVILVVVNFYGALLIEKYSQKSSTTLLVLIIFNLSFLGFFKYYNFIIENLQLATGSSHFKNLNFELPLGISFFTFQLISYVVDVKRGVVEGEKKFINFATYIFMFPHLIAGPIVRYSDLKQELFSIKRFSPERITLGAQYFIIGLCQKVLIANTLAPVADYAFTSNLNTLSFLDSWLGALAYTLQIYFDFCGYSNMAIGLALAMGFIFPRNFNYPYAASSLTDFWRRWNITLSLWFRDYVYVPMGGNRCTHFLTIRNLVIVFFLTGLWHGASWNFIVWGLFHGIVLLLEKYISTVSKFNTNIPYVVKNIYVLFVVIIGWVFFRADNLPSALQYINVMFNPFQSFFISLKMRMLFNPETIAAYILGVVFSYGSLPRLAKFVNLPVFSGEDILNNNNRQVLQVHILPAGLLLFLFVLSVFLLVGQSLNPFLYFRF
jgi:alginate O-acetyltransferase complex protein AlgI